MAALKGPSSPAAPTSPGMVKPSRVVNTLGRVLMYASAIAPKLLALVMNSTFRMFGESNAAQGIAKPETVEPSNEQVAMANLMKGVHF